MAPPLDTDDSDQADARGFFGVGNKPIKAPKRSAQQQSARKALGINPAQAEGNMADPGGLKKGLQAGIGMFMPEAEAAGVAIPAAIEEAPVIGTKAAQAAASMGRGDFLKGLGAAGAAAAAGPTLIKAASKTVPTLVKPESIAIDANIRRVLANRETVEQFIKDHALRNFREGNRRLPGYEEDTAPKNASSMVDHYLDAARKRIKWVESHTDKEWQTFMRWGDIRGEVPRTVEEMHKGYIPETKPGFTDEDDDWFHELDYWMNEALSSKGLP